jgi:hypothetical protein
MRAGLVVALIAVVLAIGPSSSAGVFPDLPGVKMLEEATTDKAPSVATSGSAPQPQDRVPAPSSGASDSTAVTRSAVTADQIAVVTSLPGGGGLPILKDVARAASGQENIAPLVLLAALFVLAFSRFLVRLNEMGSRA